MNTRKKLEMMEEHQRGVGYPLLLLNYATTLPVTKYLLYERIKAKTNDSILFKY
jgi:hypothetical protein